MPHMQRSFVASSFLNDMRFVLMLLRSYDASKPGRIEVGVRVVYESKVVALTIDLDYDIPFPADYTHTSFGLGDYSIIFKKLEFKYTLSRPVRVKIFPDIMM